MTTTELIDGHAGAIALHHLGGDGPVTLLVGHATGFLGKVYRALAHELRHDAMVVALDFRAHGDSDTPDDEAGFGWLGMVDDALRVVDHLNAATLHGFGHSMGGAALIGAERERPGTFTSLYAFEPIIPPAPFPGESPLARAARGRLRSFPNRASALERYASRPPLGLFRADVLSDYVRHGFADSEDGVTLKCTPESEASTFLNAGSVTLAHLADVHCEVVVGQSGDGGLPAQLAEHIAEALPNGSLHHFPTITHFGPLQDPVLVANDIRRQLSS